MPSPGAPHRSNAVRIGRQVNAMRKALTWKDALNLRGLASAILNQFGGVQGFVEAIVLAFKDPNAYPKHLRVQIMRMSVAIVTQAAKLEVPEEDADLSQYSDAELIKLRKELGVEVEGDDCVYEDEVATLRAENQQLREIIAQFSAGARESGETKVQTVPFDTDDET